MFLNESDSGLTEFESKMGYTSYRTLKGENFYAEYNPLQSSLLATIINQDGIHQVGDTAIKVHFTGEGYKLYLLNGVTEDRITELNNLKLSDYIYEISNEDIFRDKEKSGCPGGCIFPAIHYGKIEYEYTGINPNNSAQGVKYRFYGRAHFDNIGTLKHVYHLVKHKRKNSTNLTPPQQMRSQANIAEFEYKKGAACIPFAGSTVQVVSFSSAPVLRNNFYVNTRCARKAKVNGWFRGMYNDFFTNQIKETEPINFSFDL